MNPKNLLALLVFITVFSVSFASQALTWKGVFVAGDDSIENFDNGREDLSKLFSGMADVQELHFSSSQKYLSASENVYPATIKDMTAMFGQLNVTSNQGCLIHMTSHGAKGQGFYLAMSGILAPETFAQMVNQACGDSPTVILVSACYSGQFITESLKGPNRVILTAARPDRPSFGCSADTEYTYWDGCLLDEVPRSQSWQDLYKNVNACISLKEGKLGARPSEPQAFFGDNTKDWGILR